MRRNAIVRIRLGLVAVGAAALTAAVGVSASASETYQTGYSSVQLVSMLEQPASSLQCADPDAPALITRAYPPEYPQIALEQGVEGSAVISFTLDPDGNVSNALVAGTSGNRLFDRAAVDAVNKSRFSPATISCSKITGIYGVRVVFAKGPVQNWPVNFPFVAGGSRPLVK